MKTEKEFSEYFLTAYQAQLKAHGGETDSVQQIVNSYWTDMTSHLSSYFSNEDRLLITKKAAELFAENSKTQDTTDAWKKVLLDFNQNNYWDFQQISKKPKVGQTEEQKIFWKLFKYAWAFFQSMIILKIAVYYFGLESAEHPDQTSKVWVWLFFSLSASSLFYFAYRNRNDKN